jgi:hypothetical protein
MTSTPPQPDPATVLRTMRILSGALAGGVRVFAVIAIALTYSGSYTTPLAPPAPGASPAAVAGMHPMVAVLSLVGIGLAFFLGPAALIFRAKILAAGRDPDTGAVAPASFASAHLVAHAAFEGFGILGGVLILLSGSLIPGLPLALLSVLFIAATFPSRRALMPDPYARTDDDTPYNRSP